MDTDSRAGVEEDDGGARNVHHKEAVLLMQKLPEQLHRHNVILSHDNLRLLAIIHESLVSSHCTSRDFKLDHTYSKQCK